MKSLAKSVSEVSLNASPSTPDLVVDQSPRTVTGVRSSPAAVHRQTMQLLYLLSRRFTTAMQPQVVSAACVQRGGGF